MKLWEAARVLDRQGVRQLLRAILDDDNRSLCSSLPKSTESIRLEKICESRDLSNLPDYIVPFLRKNPIVLLLDIVVGGGIMPLESRGI